MFLNIPLFIRWRSIIYKNLAGAIFLFQINITFQIAIINTIWNTITKPLLAVRVRAFLHQIWQSLVLPRHKNCKWLKKKLTSNVGMRNGFSGLCENALNCKQNYLLLIQCICGYGYIGICFVCKSVSNIWPQLKLCSVTRYHSHSLLVTEALFSYGKTLSISKLVFVVTYCKMYIVLVNGRMAFVFWKIRFHIDHSAINRINQSFKKSNIFSISHLISVLYFRAGILSLLTLEVLRCLESFICLPGFWCVTKGNALEVINDYKKVNLNL